MQEQNTFPTGGALPRAATPLRYRADIDGLRAVAVLLVIAEHLRTSCLGGYIGVDVFFVISGYLISAIVLKEFREGTFSLARFYERRIRRILPALVAVLVFSTALAPRYLLPSELISYAQSMLAALFSFSNMLFLHQAGYFDTPSTLKPLLHTWSLAVEEQFYLFFPLLLMAVRRWFWTRLRAAIWICFTISLGAGAWFAVREPSSAFFLAPLRAWELLAGVILSQRYVAAPSSPAARHAFGIAGLLMILVPAFLYTENTIFPGVAAIPPVLGACCIISAGENGSNLAGRILGWRPIVVVGLMSYSLYLWHWPILTYQRLGDLLVNAQEGSHQVKLAVFAASVIVSFLSWRFIETPFRQGRLRPSRRKLFGIAAAAVAALCFAAVGLIAARGLPGRFPPDALQYIRYGDNLDRQYTAFRKDICFLGGKPGFPAFQRDVCIPAPGNSSVLLLGDSHAADLYSGLKSVFPERQILQANYSSCLPLLHSDKRVSHGCRAMRKEIFGSYLVKNHVPVVLLSGRWDGHEMANLKNTADWIKNRGMTPIIIGPAMEYSSSLPRLLALAIVHHDPGLPARAMLTTQRETDREMKAIVPGWGYEYISALDDLCSPSDGACPTLAAPATPMLFDTDHLSTEGAILFGQKMRAKGQIPPAPAASN